MTMNFDNKRVSSSFRDPAGYMFEKDGVLYRKINPIYFDLYHQFMECGLYAELTRFHAIVEHEEISSDDESIIIRPQMVPYISYPYEWSFGELKDAALLTLKIHRRALKHNMILKDATAYNVQFINGYATLIDTLSFDKYVEGEPWGAYGQFCRHFLAPLLLMRYKDIRMNKMQSLFIDGIPLDLASSILGRKGGMLARQHIVWHSKSVSQHNEDGKKQSSASSGSVRISKNQHLALIESLIRGIGSLELKGVETEWGDYYAHTNYTAEAGDAKALIIREYLKKISPESVWDLGANDGTYSKLAMEQGAHTVAFDIDPIAVERNYQQVKKDHTKMLPLILDLTNPSPAIGFANNERENISSRQRPDCIMVLAVIHHMAISNNLPLPMLAEWFSSLSDTLIIEFVPKEDSQVQILLATRKDIFPDYTVDGFESAFLNYYEIVDKKNVQASKREIYLMKKRHL